MWTVLFTQSNAVTNQERLLCHHLGYFRKKIYMYCQKYWRWVQHVCNDFWTQWKKEVFVTLQSRQKLNCKKQNFQVRDVVLVRDDMMRYKWLMARVITTYPDKKGIIQSVRNIQDISILMGGVCRWHILRFDTGWERQIPFLPTSILLGLTCAVWYN